MGSQSSGGSQQTIPGTLSPVTATVLELFGSPVTSAAGQLQTVPYQQFGEGGGVFSPESFASLSGLMTNIPQNPVETAALGTQGLGFLAGLQSQGLLNQGAQALTQQLAGPEAAIAQARRGFSQETLPAILERAPGFSSSDLQRELSRAGVDLETNVAALRDQNLTQLLGLAPGYAQALGTNLFDQAAATLGFGQLGRDFMREVSPSGDAFRTLSAIQSLTGPAITSYAQGSQSSKGGGFWG